MAKFNERLKQLRTDADLSQQDLAKIIGTSKSSVNMYERGEREPGIETLENIADYFNVDMDYLIGRSDHKNSIALFGTPNSPTINSSDNIIPIPTKNDERVSTDTIRIAGRDGSFVERQLTDDQIDLLQRIIEQMPDFEDS